MSLYQVSSFISILACTGIQNSYNTSTSDDQIHVSDIFTSACTIIFFTIPPTQMSKFQVNKIKWCDKKSRNKFTIFRQNPNNICISEFLAKSVLFTGSINGKFQRVWLVTAILNHQTFVVQTLAGRNNLRLSHDTNLQLKTGNISGIMRDLYLLNTHQNTAARSVHRVSVPSPTPLPPVTSLSPRTGLHSS